MEGMMSGLWRSALRLSLLLRSEEEGSEGMALILLGSSS